MKNKLYVFGIICVLLILTGAMFKIQHWTGAGILLTLGLSSFALVFSPAALISSYRTETDKKVKRLYVIAYICILIDSIGVLFKIQHWPGVGFFLIVSIPLPFVLFLPAYLLQIRKNKQLNYNNLILVLFFFAYFAAITALLSHNVSKDILDEYVDSAKKYEQQAKLTKLQTRAIVENFPVSPANDSALKTVMLEIKAKSESICQLINKLTTGLIKGVDDCNQQIMDANGNIDLSTIVGLDDKNIYKNEIFIAKTTMLKDSIAQYKNLLVLSLNRKKTEVVNYLNTILKTEGDWQFTHFDGKIMAALLDELSLIKSNVALAELETITAIANKAL